RVVACDERGILVQTREFAEWLQGERELASHDVVFMLGGAYGLGDAVLGKADMRLALARWTMPHDLARLVLVEQLYRAGTLLRGEPYHKLCRDVPVPAARARVSVVSELRILTRDPELSPLAALALQDGAPGGWFTARARNSAEWVAQIDSVRAEFDHRSWRESLAPALSSTVAAAERLARVAAVGGVVVTTGQQPGLFGGPIYTFSKALGALALADVLEAATGIPVAPVFWAATYDADFAEASVTYLASGDHVERLRMSPPDSPPRGMSETPLGDVTPLVRLLERGTGAAADPGVMALVRAAYHEGATVGDAFVSLLRALLEPLGIAVLDAGQACVRQAERPLMLRALRDAAAVEAAVQARDDTLRRLGHEPVVAQVPGLSLVFTTENGVRSRVPI